MDSLGVSLARVLSAVAVGCFCAACPAGDDTTADTESTSTTGTSTTSSSTAAPTTTGTTSTATTVNPSTGPDDTTTSTPPETTSGSSSGVPEGSSSSTGPGCPVGTDDCPCDRGSCDKGLDCVMDVCVDPLGCAAEPDEEPNDDETQAQDLGDSDCGELGAVTGAIDMGDIDWFTYHGVATDLCDEQTIAILDPTPNVDLEVCMYFECDMGPAQVVCMAGSSDAVSDEGRPGCCGTGSVQYSSTNCLGAAMSDSGDIYLSVAGPDEAMCVDYELAYRFLM